MRLTGFLFLAALALFPSASRADGIVVSSFGCPPTIECDTSSGNFPSDAQLTASASACVTRNLTVIPNVSLFDSSGLDSGGCLTTNPQAFPVGSKVTTTPQCCVKKTPRGSCILSCDVIAR